MSMRTHEFPTIGNGRRPMAFFVIALLFVFGMTQIPTPAAANPKYASMVVDHHTGRVLHSRHADASRFPASLTKVMTLYILFDEMKAGRIKSSDRMRVSTRAAAQPPSKIWVKAGSTIRVDSAIKALVTKSANDVATVVAEHISGSETAFAKRMTRKARQIGMRRTTFKNASGLPNSGQVTTARDMVTMARSIMVNHPGYYRHFNTRSFRYAGRTYRNHNRLLGRVSGVDGIKTGYTRASGFNLVSSRRVNNKHIVAVVMGGRSGKSRNAHMTNLLQRHLGSAVARRSVPRVPPGVALANLQVPVPERRPGTAPQATIVAAATAPTARTTAPAPETTSEVTSASAAPAQNVIMAASSAPQVPAAQQDVVPTVPVGGEPVAENRDGPAPFEPADAIPTSGWAIQIGAVGSNDEARNLIEMAKAKSVPAIRDTTAFTEPTVKNGETFVRARFAGFSSARQAQNACRQMKKQGFGCFAISL
ncbi:MAG: D-alanyl-D-alanine carboxypeptidase [Pseudomonadota bacterium]